MDNRESFVLIKPDGLENKEITCCLHDKFKENNINIIDKDKIILSCEDVLVMWPAYMNCYVSKELLINYLANKEVEVWRVTGDYILDKLKRIKKYIRDNYGKGCIANCIHTPFDTEEARWQYAYIKKEKIEIDSMKKGVKYHVGLFGKMLNIDKKILKKTINDVMIGRNKGIDKQIVINELNRSFDNHAIVTLLDQTKISIDYAVSVIMEVFGDYYYLKDIINIILDVDLFGERRLIITSYERASMFRDILVNKYKLDVDIEKIVRV